MLEPDRKELLEAPAYQFPINRREFLEVAGVIIFLPAAKALAQDAPTLQMRPCVGTRKRCEL